MTILHASAFVLAMACAAVATSRAATAPRPAGCAVPQDPKPDPKVQEPKKEPQKPKDDLLDAEREKLRLKDVEGWKKLTIKSLDQVVDVKKTTVPVELPASITDAEKTKMAELLQKAKEAGGARSDRALRELEKMGYPALLFLINHLREIDYKDTDSAFFGMRINMTLQNITMGINTGYVAIELGEPMDPRKAQYNAMTVQEWLKAVSGADSHWPTREKFDAYIARRKAKKEAELEKETGGGDGKPAPEKKPDEKKKG